MNGYVSVDSFFFLSGLLVCFIFFRDISKKGYYDVPLQYLHRYIRLTPPYAVMILITAKLFPYFGNGPMWHSIVHSSSQVCKDNWWQGLIYLQNYLTPTSTVRSKFQKTYKIYLPKNFNILTLIFSV